MSILVVGSLNMDLVINTNKMPKLGETLLGSNFFTSCGGKGGNQCVAIGKLGQDVSMVGCVGNDSFGENLKKSLSDANVNIDNIKVCNSPTGTAMIVVVNGNNFIVLDQGANGHITTADIDELEHLIEKSKIIVLQLEIPFNTVERTIQLAKKHNVKVVLNPAPIAPLNNFIYENTDIIILNEIEAEELTNIPVNTKENIENAINFLLQKGIKEVVITLGAEGVSFSFNNQIIHKQSLKVNVVDTTSAGDSFIGAMVSKLHNGDTLDSAVDFAIYSSALTVTKSGAQCSLPTLDEVLEFIKATPIN